MNMIRRGLMVLASALALGVTAETTAVNWVGGGVDNLTTTLANWSIGGETPSELPDLTGGTLAVTLKGGTGITYADGDKFASIVNDIPVTNAQGAANIFRIQPATTGAKLKIVTKIESIEKCQMVVSGHFTYDGTTAPTFRYDEFGLESKSKPAGVLGLQYGTTKWSAMLIYDNVIIDLDMQRSHGATYTAFCSAANSFNVINGYVKFYGYQGYTGYEAGSVTEYRGGFDDSQFFHYIGTGECRFFGDKTLTFAIGSQIEGAKVVFANGASQLNVTGNSSREGLLFDTGTVEFATNNVFNATTQFSASSDSAKIVEFNTTTQRIGRFNFIRGTASPVLRGNYGSMVEITGKFRTGANAKQVKVSGVNVPVNGGLGFHAMFEGNEATNVFTLAKRDFASCGDLAVSGGTLKLANDATWMNGTNFTMKGEGVMEFSKENQVNAMFARFHFGGNGKVSIPSGVTLRVQAADVDDGSAVTSVADGVYDGSSGVLKDRIIGGGSLRVLAHNPFDVDTEGGKYAYTYPYYFVTVPQGESNSLASAAYTITKVTDSGDVDGSPIAYDDFKVLASGTFFKKGKGVLELNEALVNWLGQNHVLEGMVVAGASQCLGKAAASSTTTGTYVHNGATLYMDNRMKANPPEGRRIAFEGTGCDGRGALLGNAASGDAYGWDVGLYPTLTGDATMRVLRNGNLFNFTFQPDSTFYQNGHTAIVCGDAANAASGMRLNHRVFEAGNIVFSNMTFTLYGSSPKIKGGPANYIRFIGQSIFYSQGFGAGSSETGRTIIFDDFKYFTMTKEASADNVNTSYSCWEGPAVLNCDVPLHRTDAALAKVGFTGYVSGKGGFPLYNKDSRSFHFHLACPSNSFEGGVAVRNGWLSLHCNGAAPVGCAGLVLTNSSLRLYGTETYRLPKASFYGAGMITNADAIVDGMFVKLVKEGAGELAMASGIGADELVFAAGGIRVNDDVPAEKMPVFGTMRVTAGTSISAPHAISITNELVFSATGLSTETAALTVNGDIVFGPNATIDVPGICRTGNYKLLSVSGEVTGMPTTTKAGDPISLEGGAIVVKHVNPYDFDTEGGKYTYTYPYFVVEVPQGQSNSLASAAFSIVKVTSIDDTGTPISYADFKALSAGTFFKTGLGTLEMNEALDNWGGQIHVIKGMLLANVSKALGILNAGTAYATYVHNGATLYMDNRQKLGAEAKRLVIEGNGMDGRGALLGNQASGSDLGWDVGTDPTLSSNVTMRVLRSGNLFNFTWSPAQAFHLGGYTATLCGDAANAGSGFRVNNATVDAGNIVLSNMTMTIYGQAPQFKGGSENYIRLIGKSAIYSDSFGANSAVETTKTLIFDDFRHLRFNGGNGTDFSTRVNCWEGPAVLNCDVPIYCSSSGTSKFGFTGKVTGVGGFTLRSKDDKNYHLHLAHPENAFEGPVVINYGWLSLHANGAAPVGCAGITLTNSSVRLYGAETYRLPRTTFYGAGVVTNDVFCRGGFVELVKEGAGAMTLTTGIGAESLVINAGSVAITGASSDEEMPMFGNVSAKPGASITSERTVTFTNELALSYQDLSADTPVLTVNGALKFDAGSSFRATGTKLAKGNYKLVYASEGITGVPTSVLASNMLYVDTDGKTLMVGTEGGDWPEETANAGFVGGAADSLMTTMANWEGTPASLDLTGGTLKANLRGGAEMTYSGRTWLSRLENQIAFPSEGTVTPLWIKPASDDARLEFTRGFKSVASNQLVLAGTISTPNGVDGGNPGSAMSIVYTPKCKTCTGGTPMPTGTIEGARPDDGTSYGSAPLVLAGATVDAPVKISGGYMSIGLLGYQNTTNVLLQKYAADIQAALGVMAGGVLDFRGGLKLDYRYRLVGSDQTGDNVGEIRVSGKPLVCDGRLEMQRYAHIVLDVEGNSFGEAGLCLYTGCLDFRRNNCFVDNRYLWTAGVGYAFQLEFNTTTQRFGVVRFNSNKAESELRGNYPAMMELTLQGSTTAPTNNVAINGGLGVHVCGEGTMPLAKQAYKSCGDLEASAGVLELCADASWLNGTNFTARGTGVIKFNKAGQINSDFANIRLADSGRIEIPSGVTISAKTVQLKVGEEWITFTDPMALTSDTTGALAGRITGGGTLDVVGLPQTGSKLMTFEWSDRYEAGIPYEVELSTNKLATLGGIPEGTGFSMYATVGGIEYPINVVCIAGRNGNVRLRFTPPVGTTELKCRAGVGTLALTDTSKLENIFAGALGNTAVWECPANISRTITAEGNVFAQTSKTKGTITHTVNVPASARGRNAHLELDLKSLAAYAWASSVSIAQLDANGTALPESFSDPRWTTLCRPSGYLAQHREIGRIHPEAARLRLSITMSAASGTHDDYGLPGVDEADKYAQLLVSHIAVRVGADLPFPKWNTEFLTEGVSGEAGDRAFVSGGEKAAGLFYQTRSQASWAEAKQMRKEAQFFFPSASGTMEGWFKATDWGSDTNARYLFSGSSRGSNYIDAGPAVHQHLIYIYYKRSTKTIGFGYMDQTGTNYSCSAVRELPVNEWFHIAAQWAPGGTAELFLNGERLAQVSMVGFNAYDPTTGTYPNDSHVIEMDIGCETYAVRTSESIPTAAYPLFEGAIDLCRISTGKRYDAAGGFTPAKAFEVDADTRAFFDFDTGFDGVSGGGLGWVRASVSALKDYVSHRLTLGGDVVQYYPDEVPDWNVSAKVIDTLYHKTLPTVAGYKAARSRTVESFDMSVGGNVGLTAPATVYPDYLEIENTGSDTLASPLVLGEGEVDPRSQGDVRDTLLTGAATDREKVDRVFQYVTDISDYYMIHTALIAANTDKPSDASYSSFTLLNALCGFECGPLNTMLQTLFNGAARVPAGMTQGYGHSFEQVFFEGKTHCYDQSAQAFFPSMDNEGRAYLEELCNQPGAMHRFARSPSHYIRHSTRGTQSGSASYVAKFAPSLRKGERFRVWFRNDGEVGDLQCGSFAGSAVAEDYREICHADGNLYRINRFFPEFGSGFLVYDGAIDLASAAFAAEGDTVTYSVDTKYPIVAADYKAELTSGGEAELKLSTDGGTTWRDLTSGKVRYEVRARTAYLIRVMASAASVSRFTAVTEVQVNSRTYPGRVRGGSNSFTLKAVGSGTAKVSFAYRSDAKEIVISGGAYAGTIPGCERQVVVVNPGTPLVLDVTGASANATVRTKGGIAATLASGKLTIAAGTLAKGFGAVQIVDGGAVKELRVIVSANARLVTAADTLVATSGSTLVGPDSGSIQSRLDFVENDKTARANFTSLPAGKYAVFALVRHETQPGNFRNGRFSMSVPGVSGTLRIGRAVNSAYDFYKAMYGKDEARGRYKWDYSNDPSTSYPMEMQMIYDVPAAFDHVDFSSVDNAGRETELAAVLVLPVDKANVAGDEDFQCEAVKELCGLNNDPWQVEAGVSRKTGMMFIFR